MAHIDLFPRTVPPRTVVVPLDGSRYAAGVLPYGERLARRFGARVQTVTVGDRADVAVEVRLAGDPAAALLAHLAHTEHAIVCMASHGHGGLRRRLVGSVAEAVIRRAPVPVVVHGPEAARSEAPPRTLLAGVAWNQHLEPLLATLSVWAPLLGARIELAHVRYPTAAELYVARTTGQSAADQPDLDMLSADLTGRGVPTAAHLLAGDDPTTALLAFARHVPTPVLLAVDSHRAGEPAGHDIAYELIRRSPWPVLATAGL
jgi:nucleotide-binding universal stress UspA family protein